MNTQIIVFSDLDATLLNREDYSFEPALPALDLLQKNNIPLILNSSKTIAEISELRSRLNNTHPFVVENGAAVLVPVGYFSELKDQETISIEGDDCNYCVIRFGDSYEHILQALNKARQAGFVFTGFNQWSADELAQVTSLDSASASRAKQRLGSEPLLLEGDTSPFNNFLNSLGLRTVQGGRFLHVMGQYDKADGVKWLLKAYRKKYQSAQVKAIALGDSHNDVGMLNCADYPVVIKSPHSHAIKLNNTDRVRFSQSLGPAGWNEVMLDLVPKLLSHSENNNAAVPNKFSTQNQGV
ncbi:MAG: HAD-IIB family hydrolase [Pseudohongiellaceae bacterium]|nr:HAD-IIB family hydrolase [Pseudohongiellaceae bacterium]